MSYCINSLLEQDAYKYSMGQFAKHRYPTCKVSVDFVCRSGQLLGDLKEDLDRELDHYCSLRYTPEEINYLKSIEWLSEEFINDLVGFQPRRDYIKTWVDNAGRLHIRAEGPWCDVIYFEVPVLAMVQETYVNKKIDELFESTQALSDYYHDRAERLALKIEFFKSLSTDPNAYKLSEFGLRRRVSGEWEDKVVETLKNELGGNFAGTSNVYLAMKHGVKPSGTMAHELYMALQGYYPLHLVQKETWKQWMDEYRGKNGILLSDIFGFNACLKDCDWFVANSFQGFRHDSGDPLWWGEKLISFYESVGIDPRTKVFCWSDTLNNITIGRIFDQFRNRVKIAFGVGTWLTADSMVEPLSIVMKLTHSNGQPVIKLPDGNGKIMCPDPELERYAKHVFGR